MSELAVRIEGLGKAYRISHRAAPYRTLQQDLLGMPRRLLSALRPESAETVWVLKDVSHEVRRGEVLGIIGRNGAGKSTLLKILSRVTEPSAGRAEIFGRVGSLLEVGTGFHPELTGRENIFLSGAVLGMKRAEIERRFDEIVAFADVEKFLDTPAKHFSSGMYMRLAFAVAAHLEPEILLLDEVLAVGDAEFQRKCLGVMDGIARSGRTILFVSHNLAVVENLCTRSILLDRGRVLFDGPSREVVARYLALAPEDPGALSARLDRFGDGRLRLTRLEMIGPGGIVRTGAEARFRLHYRALSAPLRNVSFAISINSPAGGYLLLFSTDQTNDNRKLVEEDGVVELTIPFLPLAAGSYGINVFAAVNGIVADNVAGAATLQVDEADYYKPGRSRPAGHPPFVAAHRWAQE